METVVEISQKSAAFAYLASVFMDLPDERLIRSIRALGASGAEQGTGPVRSIAGYAHEIAGKNDGQVIVELGVDRARLVRHVDASCIEPPYESVYVRSSEDAVLCQINRFADEESLAPARDAHEPNDYLGMELSFMQYTYSEQAKAILESDAARAQRMERLRGRFWKEHLGRWVGSYGGKMRGAASTSYYRAVGELLCGLA